MNLAKLLQDYKDGKLSQEALIEHLKLLPFEDLGSVKIDHHRQLRRGFPEVIFCLRKNVEEIAKATQALDKQGTTVLLTKLNQEKYAELKKQFPHMVYNEKGSIAYIKNSPLEQKEGLLILTAGTSDIPIAEEAKTTAEVMGQQPTIVHDVGVAGLHRLLAQKEHIFKAKVIIVIAGMEGALASVVAGLANCPVIAVPTSVGYGASFDGLNALLSMMNTCSPGVSVVNIDNGFGAGYLAAMVNK